MYAAQKHARPRLRVPPDAQDSISQPTVIWLDTKRQKRVASEGLSKGEPMTKRKKWSFCVQVSGASETVRECKVDSPKFAEGGREEGKARGELAKRFQMTTAMVMRSSTGTSRHSHGVYASGTPVLVACGLCSIEEKTR